jgi:hypothetical protein
MEYVAVLASGFIRSGGFSQELVELLFIGCKCRLWYEMHYTISLTIVGSRYGTTTIWRRAV